MAENLRTPRLSSKFRVLIKKKTCIKNGKKRSKKSVETGHARIPGEALREYATTNGGGYRGPGKPYQILSDLFVCYQYYLVNK